MDCSVLSDRWLELLAGRVYTSLYFLLCIFLLIVGNSLPPTRAVVTVLAGLIGFGLVMWLTSALSAIGDNIGLITRKPGLPGMFVAAAISLLAAITGSLQLRNTSHAGSVVKTRCRRRQRILQPASDSISLLAAISGFILPILMLTGGIVLSS